MKSRNVEFPEQDSAIAAVLNLTLEVAKYESYIAEGLKQIADSKAKLATVLGELKTATKEQDLTALKLSKTACRLSVAACKESNTLYQSIIDGHKSEMQAILKRTPEARQDN